MDAEAARTADDEKLVFETSGEVDVTPSFDNMGLKEELVRGIYAYGELSSSCLCAAPRRPRPLLHAFARPRQMCRWVHPCASALAALGEAQGRHLRGPALKATRAPTLPRASAHPALPGDKDTVLARETLV